MDHNQIGITRRCCLTLVDFLMATTDKRHADKRELGEDIAGIPPALLGDSPETVAEGLGCPTVSDARLWRLTAEDSEEPAWALILVERLAVVIEAAAKAGQSKELSDALASLAAACAGWAEKK